jgi:hypothetical protein
MIVIFGASSDLGRRLGDRLRDNGIVYRAVSRSIEGAVYADLGTGSNVKNAMADARIIVSCAHARYTATILKEAPADATLILVGSAWLYSRVANPRADAVRQAEAFFLAGCHKGVMLHPTMIYGGNQENNLRRLLLTIRRLPVIPCQAAAGTSYARFILTTWSTA